ncbi:DUF1254 domain-containing protein [Methanoregula sp.]|uniref:DUF1254 domain-containing protein n=1 Tax=Methanoregula sp. TaxID=2052170 RepID=UPI003BB218AC
MRDGAITRRRVLVVICVALLITASLLIMAYLSAVSQADYNKGYEIGLEAYTYGLPLLETSTTFETMTSINVSDGAFGPVNQFNNVRTLNNPGSTVVVAPGSNGLSSIAWLDLSKEPQVLHVPEVQNHFFVLALIDPYTNDLQNFGSVHNTPPGDYVIAGPGQQNAPIPAGTQHINVDYNRIWIIGSTQLKGTSDLATVNLIQDNYTLTPLNQYGTNYQPENVTNPNTTVQYYQIPGGLDFFDMLGQQLKEFPPPAADQPELAKFAEVGIGPGMAPSHNVHLSKDTVRGLQDAVAAGPAQIKNDTQTLFLASFDQHNGYLVGGFGQYGTNYPLRAVVSQVGLGAFTSDQAIFAMSWADRNKTPLNGSTNYVLHMASAPPVNEGWTLTVYDLKGALIPNPINRFEFSDTSQLTNNTDGSVDIYLQSTQPSDPAQANNWLPTASGQGFEVIWRLMAPQPAAIPGILNGTGWQPPAITAVP